MTSAEREKLSEILALAQEIADTEHIGHDEAYQQAEAFYSRNQQESADNWSIRLVGELYVFPTAWGAVLCRDGRRVVVHRSEAHAVIQALQNL